MKISRMLFWIGIILYIVSFFLAGVKDSGASPSAKGYPGYICAYLTLLTPWGHDAARMLQNDTLDYFGILFSGWINPVFLITAISLLVRPHGKLGTILRIVLILMFAAPWIVFHKEHVYPVIGYYLWTAAMLLTVFSTLLSKTK